VLVALERSEMSVAAFAESNGLTPQRLYWWRSRLTAPARTTSRDDGYEDGVDLIPVHVRETPSSPVGPSTEAIVIRLPSGAAIEIPASKSPSWVAAFVRSLDEA